MEVSSVRATDWRSSLLDRALKRLERRPKDAVVVTGMGGRREQPLTVTISGVAAERLAAELQTVFPRQPGSKWQAREVAGKSLAWASGREFTQAYWAREGQVVGVAGDAEAVERAISRLP